MLLLSLSLLFVILHTENKIIAEVIKEIYLDLFKLVISWVRKTKIISSAMYRPSLKDVLHMSSGTISII